MRTIKFKNTDVKEFVLNEFTKGYAQCIDNNWNFAAYAQDPGVSIYQNDYNAGYVQGKVVGNAMIKATRNNTWRWYVLDEGPGADSTDIPENGLEIVTKHLVANYNWLTDYVEKNQASDQKVRNIMRLMYRMLGIFHGSIDKEPLKNVSFDDLKLSNMDPYQSATRAGDDELSFMDIYFINAQMDIWDAAGKELGVAMNKLQKDIEEHRLDNEEMEMDRFQKDLRLKPGRCSGFVKKLENGDVIWTHTSWCCMMAQTCAMTYVVGEDFLTQNSFCPGQFGSNTDFGFNGHGIGFNETTETYFYTEPKTEGLWLTWRAAAAEAFATSIEDFYDYLKMDNTGTYLSAYMVVDAFKEQFGMVDMSYCRFVLFKGDGEKLTVQDSTGYEPMFLDWDHHMATESHILGCNIPVYKRIWRELETIDGAPKRRYQLYRSIPNVLDIESAQRLITYNENLEPISIAGRWDNNYGTSEFMRYQPHGSIDAKVFSASKIREVLAGLTMKPSKDGQRTSFIMKFGSPYIDGSPFAWSTSRWAKFKLPEEVDFIPDVIDGRWNSVKMFME